jgi:ankyrin repeat protein
MPSEHTASKSTDRALDMKAQPAFDAIANNEMARLMMFLMKNNEPNARDANQRTLLIAACESPQDRHGFVQHLLQSGAFPSLKDQQGNTALHALATKQIQNIHSVEALIEAGAALNEKDARGRTALHHMAKSGWIDGCASILNAAPRLSEVINVQDNDGKTPLLLASENEDLDALVCLLMAHGADPRITDNEGRGPAQWVQQNETRVLMLAKIKALCKADAERLASEAQPDPEFEDIMKQSKAVLAKSYLRESLSSFAPAVQDTSLKNSSSLQP